MRTTCPQYSSNHHPRCFMHPILVILPLPYFFRSLSRSSPHLLFPKKLVFSYIYLSLLNSIFVFVAHQINSALKKHFYCHSITFWLNIVCCICCISSAMSHVWPQTNQKRFSKSCFNSLHVSCNGTAIRSRSEESTLATLQLYVSPNPSHWIAPKYQKATLPTLPMSPLPSYESTTLLWPIYIPMSLTHYMLKVQYIYEIWKS